MSLFSKYENLEPLAQGNARVFRAHETTSHRSVLLHHLGSATDTELRQRLQEFTSRGSSRLPGGPTQILGIEEHENSLWAITEDVPEMKDLRARIERTAGSGAVPASQNQTSLTDSEATSILPTRPSREGLADTEQTLIMPQGGNRPERAVKSDDSPTAIFGMPPLSASETTDKSEDLPTAIFSAPKEVTSSSPSAPVSYPTPGQPSKPHEPLQGELNADEPTRILSPTLKSETKPSARSDLPSAPGSNSPTTQDSTMILQSPPEIGAESDVAKDKQSNQLFAKESHPPGEFTMLFQSGSRSGTAQTPAGTPPPSDRPTGIPSQPGEATQLSGIPSPIAPPASQKQKFRGFTASSQKLSQRDVAPPASSPFASKPVEPSPEVAHSEQTAERSQGPGEFTQMFQAPLRDSSPPSSDLPPFQNRESMGAAQPGEFTRMFQTGDQDQAAAHANDTPETFDRETTQEPSGSRQEPGAFTQMFQIPVGSDLLTSSNERLSRTQPGTPSKISPESATASPQPEEAKTPSPQPPSGPSSAGVQFTPPSVPVVTPQVSPPAQFVTPSAPVYSAPSPTPMQMPVSPVVPQTPQAPTTPAPNASAPQASPKPTGPSLLPLILIFGGIALVAIFLVLFFLTKH